MHLYQICDMISSSDEGNKERYDEGDDPSFVARNEEMQKQS